MESSGAWSPLDEGAREHKRTRNCNRSVNIKALLVLGTATMVSVVTLAWNQHVVRRAVAQQQIRSAGSGLTAPKTPSIRLTQFNAHSLVATRGAERPQWVDVPSGIFRTIFGARIGST